MTNTFPTTPRNSPGTFQIPPEAFCDGYKYVLTFRKHPRNSSFHFENLPKLPETLRNLLFTFAIYLFYLGDFVSFAMFGNVVMFEN